MTAAATTTQTDRWNIWAILAIVFVWFTVIPGLIFGHVALAQIKRTGERGRGLALTAVIFGWIAVVSLALFAMFFLIWGGMYVSSNG